MVVARRNGSRQRKRIPSASWARSGARSRSRTCWKGVRIATRATNEPAYETASTAKGKKRAMPKSAPPIGGPPTPTAPERACCTVTAAASSSVGTTARTAPTMLAWNTASPAPSTAASKGIGQKTGSAATSRASAARAIARTASAASSCGLRGRRSAATPASSASSGIGASRANETSPAFAGECVTARTSSGYATELKELPVDDRSCPACSSTKSRFRLSAIRRWSLRRGQGDREPRAARRALDGRLAAVRLGRLAHDREAEPGARLRARGGGAVEAVEDPRQVLLGDAGALVGDDDLALAHDHFDRCAGGAVLHCVVEQVRDRPFDKNRIDAHMCRRERGDEDGVGRAGLRALDRGGDEIVERDVLDPQLALLAACELDEVGDERGE